MHLIAFRVKVSQTQPTYNAGQIFLFAFRGKVTQAQQTYNAGHMRLSWEALYQGSRLIRLETQ